VRLTFRGETLSEPVIYRVGQNFRVVTNIRRAEVGEDMGWLELDLDGEQAEVDGALEYIKSRGINVEPLKS
jgi:ABC-type methionine transport system ATPase subunit